MKNQNTENLSYKEDKYAIDINYLKKILNPKYFDINNDKEIENFINLFYRVHGKEENSRASKEERKLEIIEDTEYLSGFLYDLSEDEKENLFKYTIPKNLKYYRKLKGITQSQLADSLGKSLSIIQKYESGKVHIPFNVLLDITEALSVDIQLIVEKDSYINDIYCFSDVSMMVMMLNTLKNINMSLLEFAIDWNYIKPDYNLFKKIAIETLGLDDKALYNWIFSYSCFEALEESEINFSQADFKHLIDNEIIIKEDPHKLISEGLSKENQDIIKRYMYIDKNTNPLIYAKNHILELDISKFPDIAVKDIKDYINYICFKYNIEI